MTERRHRKKIETMLSTIEAHARHCADETGRPRLSPAVMDAMAATPRHLFVPADMEDFAYEDGPLPIGAGKTISQPFMVALATDLIDPVKDDVVLEVGAGLGYQAAVLSNLCKRVYAIEIISELGEAAIRRLANAGCDNVRMRIGDGARGWPEHAPFDGVVVSAGAARAPKALLEQLKPGGRMVAPIGKGEDQMLQLFEKDEDGAVEVQDIIPVRYSALSIVH